MSYGKWGDERVRQRILAVLGPPGSPRRPVERKRPAPALKLNAAGARRCSYCEEPGHSRGDCALLQGRRLDMARRLLRRAG